ncbi:MAG: nicotinate phosphoribosyltransferase, partial [Rhabdochlamydiaceae bacterium]
YAEVLPEQAIFLVDTYNTIEGVNAAIRVGKRLRARGYEMGGIRIDSGDLAALSIEARRLLNEAGFPEAVVVASNELDEVIIAELKHQGAQINVWGVGTNLITSKDQPALDGVYKISAIEGDDGQLRYLLKLSEQPAKVTNPGVLDIMRWSRDGEILGDLIYDVHLGVPSPDNNVDLFDPTRRISIPEGATFETLLKPVVRSGKSVYTSPELSAIRARTLETLERLPKGVKRFLNPHIFPVAMEKKLYDIKLDLMRRRRTNAI